MRPVDFAALMQAELDSNAKHKGDWETWEPEVKEALGEFGYHAAKLCSAIGAANPAKVTEYAADVGNIAMKIVDRFGLVHDKGRG